MKHLAYALISTLILLGVQYLLYRVFTSSLLGWPAWRTSFFVWASVFGGSAALVAGLVFGSSVIARKEPLSCLIGSGLTLVPLLIQSTLYASYHPDSNAPVLTSLSKTLFYVRIGIQYYWLHYLLFASCACALTVIIYHRKKVKLRKYLRRSVYVAFLIGAAAFIMASAVAFYHLNEVNTIKASDSKVGPVDVSINPNPLPTIAIVGGDQMQPGTYNVSAQTLTVDPGSTHAYKVSYAQVAGLKDRLLQEQINQILKQSITAWLTEDDSWMEGFQFEVTCQTARYLSVCYTVPDQYWENVAVELAPSFGITIDMQAGKRVYLDALVKNTSELKKILSEGVFDDDMINEVIKAASMSESDYRHSLGNQAANEAPFWFLQRKSSFYLTDTQLVVSVGHIVGDTPDGKDIDLTNVVLIKSIILQ